MLHEKQTSDKSIRWLILIEELVILNLLLLGMYFVYRGNSMMTTPNCKRLMVLMSLVYTLCDMQGTSRIHLRVVRWDQLFMGISTRLFYFTVLSLIVLWVFRWPLLTVRFMLPFYIALWISVFSAKWASRQIIKWLRKKGRNSMTVIFVGNINIVRSVYQGMQDDPTYGYHVLGYFADEEKTRVTCKNYLGKPDEVLNFLKEQGHRIHALYCILPTSENDLINKIIDECDRQMVRYNHVPDSFNYERHRMSFSAEAGIPVFTLHNEPLGNLWNRFAKRTFDVIFSSLFLLTVFPWVFLVFGALIKLSSPGPILFRQKRSGLGGKDFYCLKFRSMKVNMDSDKKQATKNDPRKTRIGEFMRKTSIDELPQFINVWRGEMSIVGPRPHMLAHTEQYSELINSYMVRHFAKPGITGYAQVTGFRGETTELWQMEERIKKDIWYIENWSMALDIHIIYKTIANAIRGEENAY